MHTVHSLLFVAALSAALSGAAFAQTAPPQAPVVDLSKQPTLYVVGYAHLDTQWRWCYPTSIREYLVNTLHDNFALMDKYPHYIFNFSGSRRYLMMKEYYPEDYEKLKKYIAAGQWFPCGSSVDENDANVPSAESLVRQVLYGNHYFRSEFGIASDEYMLPDCFGFPAALPSVLAHCGIKGFSTQKLTWGSAVGIPFKIGVWEGPDGRSVVAALDPGAYVGEVRDDLSTNNSWLTRVQNNGKLSGIFADYHYYGTGDQGGAPTEQSVQMIEKSVSGGGSGPLKVISSHADWLFNAITPDMQAKLPRYKGELLLTQHSAGSISSQAFMKRCNRKNEQLADAAEKAAIAAWWLGAEYPAKRLEDAWYLVLGSQMHDILPGTSHPKAYEYSWNDELLAANQFAAVLADSVGTVSSAMDTQAKGTGVVVFNPLSIEREDVVELSVPMSGAAAGVRVTGPDGRDVPAQVLGSDNGKTRIAILASVPSVGFAVFDIHTSDKPSDDGASLNVADRTIENERYRVTLNDAGDVASILDKKSKREMLSAPARLALMYEKPANWPAWNMDWKDRKEAPRSYVGGPAKFRITERGPVRVAIEVTREHEGSTFVQTIRLAAGDAGDRIEFDNQIDWTTRERSLKAVFPLTVSNPKASYDIQVGAIERTNNDEKHYENPAHLWFDLTDANAPGSYGVTVMNDSKYGSDKPDDSTLRLTLLYTPGTSGDYQDQGTQDIGRHRILYALAGHEGDWRSDNVRAPWAAARLNQPLRPFIVHAHAGPLGKSFSLLGASNPNVMVSATKKAEDSDQVVVRLRELTGADAKGVRISMAQPIASAFEIDGQERQIGSASIENGSLGADVHGYGLKAFALKPGAPSVKVAAPQAKPLELPFNADVISANTKRDDGSIDSQHGTYPAEQLGSSIKCNGVEFKLGPTNAGAQNAVLCSGQDLAIPGSGDVNRIELLAASTNGDQRATFAIDGATTEFVIPSWRGYIGQWDNRIWLGKVPEVANTWQPTFGGLDPGYTKQAEVAWFCSHYHVPGGDQPYQYCYLFRCSLDLPKGAKKLSLPSDGKIMILAATLVKSAGDKAAPAVPLYDALDDRSPDAPRIIVGRDLTDAVEVRIEPRLYGHADAIRYTLDGSPVNAASQKYDRALVLQSPMIVRAALVQTDGAVGPQTEADVQVNDQTAPHILRAEAVFNQPTIRVEFSEPLEKASAIDPKNFSIEPDGTVRKAVIEEPTRRVVLTLGAPLLPGFAYKLRIHNVRDGSPARNAIIDASVPIITPTPVYSLKELKSEDRGKSLSLDGGLPTKAGDAWTLNMFVRTDKEPPNRTIIAGFGACGGSTPQGDATGRYICKFPNGVHFWSHHSDLQGKAPLDLGRWQMLSATYDGKTLRLYKDAKLLSEREAAFADDDAVVNLAPVDPWDKKRQFDGQVRELTIWNASLDEEGLQTLQSSARLP